MIDRLRGALNRPVRDGDRGRLFVLAAFVVVAAAAAFALLDRPAPPREADRAAGQPSPPATPAAATAEPVEPVADGDAPSEQSRPSPESHGTREDVEAAKRAARRFLPGYLAYTYGRGRAADLEGASRELRRRLAAAPPRVPPAQRRRRPRLQLVQAQSVGRQAATVIAVVDDGAGTYTVPLELDVHRAAWLVTNVGG